MDEKLNSENVQKEQFSEWGWRVGVIKFSSPQATRGIDPLAKSCGRWCQIVFYNVDNAVTNAKARMEK